MGFMQSHIMVWQFRTLWEGEDLSNLLIWFDFDIGSTLEIFELVICYVGGEPHVIVAVT